MHPDGRRSCSSARSSALALFAQRPECLLAIDRFHPTALEIVVAAVERIADCGYLFEVPGKGILDDVVGGVRWSRRDRSVFGRFGRDVHYLAFTVRLSTTPGKDSGGMSNRVDLLQPGDDVVPTARHWGRHDSW